MGGREEKGREKGRDREVGERERKGHRERAQERKLPQEAICGLGQPELASKFQTPGTA